MDHELPLDPSSFRRLMARFATGVTILAVDSPDNGGVIGMTANAITSVSLEPFLVLCCVEKRATVGTLILQANTFSLSILNETQQDQSDYFAARWDGNPPDFEFRAGPTAPTLVGNIGSVQCRRYNVLEGGDHWIILGEVMAIEFESPPPYPLIFFGSKYHKLVGISPTETE